MEVTEAKQSQRASGAELCAWLGAALTVAAWLLMMWQQGFSICAAVVGLVVSCFALRIKSGLIRDLAITAIIAAGVLLLVYAIFFGLLYYFDKQFS